MAHTQALPLSAYALLSDCQGAALVGRNGSIDWACMPRFDAPSTFARLLDANAGHWLLTPRRVRDVTREYLRDTLVLRTEFATDDGVVVVTDCMPFGIDDRGHHIGRSSPHAILRVIEGLHGDVVVHNELAIRPEYGLTVPGFTSHDGGLRARGGSHTYLVTLPGGCEVTAGTLHSEIRVRAGERHALALRQHSAWESAPACFTSDGVERLLQATIDAWRSWSALHQNYTGPYADLVLHSGRVLQGLTYAPTGAIIAAPTTSLPEDVGGVRNWDYRYAWVRDTSLTLEALWVAACPDEAVRFFDFFAIASGERAERGTALQILYAVGGERHVAEHELHHLAGYRDSRPVRIGNGAWNQSQLDVYGELLGAACMLADQIGTQFDEPLGKFLIEIADAAASQWREPDQGIWEVRGPPQHFTYSKLMCWVALDRALQLADRLGSSAPVERWTRERDALREAILTEAWNDKTQCFTQAFGASALDASTLALAMSGFLPVDDPRIAATIDAIAERLTDERGFVYRYTDDDGLPGGEGTFAICSFWLVHCLAMRGEVERARALFEELIAFGNDVGLFSEEIDPVSGELLGNFPQAFTHVGLVNAAYAIATATGHNE